MFLIILALLILWPITELFIMVIVAQQIGAAPTLALIFFSTLSGILILRHRGRVAWGKLRTAVGERRPPAKEAFDGVMVTTGAVLLIIPGFISSGIGLLLLFPPTRYLIRITLFFLFASRYKVVATSASMGSKGYGVYRDRNSAPAYDVEGEAVDVTDYPDDNAGQSAPQLPSPESKPRP